MKKLLSILLAVVLIVGVIPMGVGIFASAATSGNYTYEIKSGKATITDVNATISGDVKLPTSLGGYTVVGIGESAFYECNRLTGITIPEGVTSIGNAAFGFCQNLTNVSLPSTVTAIAYGAFSGCAKLTNINIPDSVATIGDLAFLNCSSLTEVKIPDNVISIGEYAFGWCGKLKNIMVGNGVTTINEGTFFNCESLTDVSLGESVTDIGRLAFYNSKVANIVVPNGVTHIGNSAFENCNKLEQITLPETIKDVDSYAFYNCNSLTVVWYRGSETDEINIGHYNECLTKAIWNYGMCEAGEHTYAGSCLRGCTACGKVPDAHSYINACDTKCNECNTARKVSSHTHVECFSGYTEELYGSWTVEVSKTGVYTLKPSSRYTGEYNVHNIALFDSQGKEVLYYEKLGGFPLVFGCDYIVKFRYNCKNEINGNITWTKTRIAETIFPDTDKNGWYNDAVVYAVGRGIMSGYASNGKFGTSDSIQRQDFLVMLARLDGVDLTSYGNMKSKFPDVAEGSYFEAAVNWGSEKGIVGGYDDGKFGTGDKITREQIVTFLYRYAKYKGVDVSYTTAQKNAVKKQYSDFNNVSVFSQDAIIWAVSNGVISGKTNTTIVPQGNAQRCEVAKIMYNIFLNDLF